MNKSLFETPVLFLIYNRPDHTQKVFDVLRALRPSKLYVAADGPRMHIEGDEAKCEAARAVIKNIDWECTIETLFREKNKSTKFAVPEALDWFFSKVEEGIILEDDCVPDTSFFTFCEFLLDRYRNDSRVLHINGSNYLKGKTFQFTGSYYFSKLCHPWGWATWKRAWAEYNFEMNNLDKFIQNDTLTLMTDNPEWREYYYDLLKRTRDGEIDTWDVQWFYTVWSLNGFVLTPVVNLVSNIGFGKDATNTNYKITRLSEMKRGSIPNLVPNDTFKVNYLADQQSIRIKVNDYTKDRPETKINFSRSIGYTGKS